MLEVRVEKIRQEAPDTATFFLRRVDGLPVHYRAGQFITLVVQHHGNEIRRSYSISSSPGEELMSVTVKRVPNGELSRYLLVYAKVGDIWQVVEPTGKFVIDQQWQPDTIFYFAAGSGITPVFSQLKYLLSIGYAAKLVLIYSNRNKASILFKHELDNLQRLHAEQLTIVHLLSDEGRRLNNIGTEQLVNRYAKNPATAAFYLCGPFAYMRMVRFSLVFMGISPQNIRKENFVLDTVPVLLGPVNHAPHTVKIISKGETYNIRTGENQSILQAALQNKVPLSYSCKAGICSACAVRCKSGKVQVIYNEVLTEADQANGWILTCTGYAMDDDVVIEIE